MLVFIIRFRRPILLFVLLMTSLVLMTSHAKDVKSFRGLTSGILEVTAVMGSWLSSAATGTVNLYTEYIDLVDTKKENRILRERIARLENNLNRLNEIEIENKRLMTLLDFQKSVPFYMTPAKVVGKGFNSWSRTMIINEGSKAGIDIGMAVVRPEGVVGRILSVSPHYALVQLLIDRNSDIPGIFQRTRAQAIIEGKINNQCQAKHLNRLADIQVGDTVISSGLGGVYPKGLLIGTVASVQKKPYGLFQDVMITPAVDFLQPEEVFVVRNSQLSEYDQQLKRIQE